MTIKERILTALQGSAGFRYYGTRPLMAAVDILRMVNPSIPVPDVIKGRSSFKYRPKDVSLASLSSVLNKMVRDGTLLRVSDFGPRGGFGYALRHWNYKAKTARVAKR